MKAILFVIALLPIICFGQATGIPILFTSSGTMNQVVLDGGSKFNLSTDANGYTITIPAPSVTTGAKDLALVNTGDFPFTLSLSGRTLILPAKSGWKSLIFAQWRGSSYGYVVGAAAMTSFPQPAHAFMVGPTGGIDATMSARTVVESDLIPGLGNYRNNSQNDSRYLQNYTETDPVWSAVSGNYWNKTQSDARYLQSFTESDPVWTAASTNYYNKTQSDARYLQSFTETDPQFDTKFSGKSTTNLTEGTNLYYTASRFNTSFSGKTTADLTENTNLYYTSARFNTAFASKSTTDLTEGTNLYYTAARFNTAFSGKSTTDLTEGTRLYYTDARARLSVSATGTGLSYNNTTGIFQNTAPDQTVTLTQGRGIVITGTYPNFTIAMVAPTYSTTARALNSNFTPNATKETFAFYTITCTVTNPLLAGTSTASVFLEYSTNAGSSWNPVTSQANSSGVGVAVAIALTNGQTGVVSGVIPANALTRLRSATSGTASVTILSTFEMVY